jgi:hypothetical protein
MAKQIKPVSKRTRLITFDVQGRGEFPFDMLRYDACFPASSTDAALMAVPERSRIDGFPRTITIKLKRWVPPGYPFKPTAERWASFGWSVVPDSITEES